jgi:hypothetical protein
MDSVNLTATLEALVNKVESFARSLDDEERDLLASIFQLAIIGAAETDEESTTPLYMLNHQPNIAVLSVKEDILSQLPSRVLQTSQIKT